MTRQTLSVTVELHREQARFCRSPSLFRGFVGGRGSGKSWVGGYDLLLRAMLLSGVYVATSPTYPKLNDEVIPTVRSIAERLGIWRSRKFRASPRPSLVLPSGSVIRFRSTDEPDSLRGPNLSGFWMDEASLSDRQAYLIAIACLREKGRMGWLSATFTPKGRSHWTCDVFATGRPDTELFRAHTRENPFLPPNFADVISRQYGGDESLLSRQELGGEFVQLEGAEWPAEYFGDDLWFVEWPRQLTVRVLALDPSKGQNARVNDYAAFVFLGVDPQGTLWCEADLLRGRGTDFLARTAVDHCRAWGPDLFGVEVNFNQQVFCEMIESEARKQGLPIPLVGIDNQAPKVVRIRRLGPYLAQRKIRFADTPGTRLLVQQLAEFPEGAHDDGPDSLEMALRILLELLGRRGGGTVEDVIYR